MRQNMFHVAYIKYVVYVHGVSVRTLTKEKRFAVDEMSLKLLDKLIYLIKFNTAQEKAMLQMLLVSYIT